MSSRHGNSRRQAYGRRMKELRTRRAADVEVDLEGPNGWNRGGDWDGDGTLRSAPIDINSSGSGARAR